MNAFNEPSTKQKNLNQLHLEDILIANLKKHMYLRTTVEKTLNKIQQS